MARLTEEMVIARTRASDLTNIRKLNCWGSELSDVSLLRRMENVEVLALSVNKIGSLSDFQFCRNLQELYVRKNEIRDLNQVLYLQDLPRLKNLWLEENPCANTESYRLTVLRALPQLQKLDNIAVQPEEVQDAARRGRELVHPDEEQTWPSETSSPAQSPTRQERRTEDTDIERRQEEMAYYDTDRRNANYEPEPGGYTRQQSVPYNAVYEGEEDIRVPEERYRQPPPLGPLNNRPHLSRRPVTRNSNILSAVLCLIKELDYPSLEVVEMAVKSRMDEF